MRTIDSFGTDTIVWRDDVVTHDLAQFPQLELTEHRGSRVRAYARRPESLFELFSRAVESCPEREFLVVPGSDTRDTYREVAGRADRLAAGLADLGLSKGDHVGLVCDNRREFVDVVLAGARLGVVPAVVNPAHSPGVLGRALDRADPELVVVEDSYVEAVDASAYDRSEERTVVVGSGGGGRAYESLPGDGAPEVDPPSESDRCAVMYTSGTTGQPKGVPVDNFHCTNATLNNAHAHGLERGATVLVPSPLFHVTGLVCGLFTTIAVGGTAVVLPEYSPERFVGSIESESVTYCMGVPTHVVLAVERTETTAHDLSSFEKFAYGGAPMPADALPKIGDALPETRLYHSYGKTENFAGIASMVPDRHVDERPESVGMPTPAVKFAVVDENRDRLPPGELGELAMYGPFVTDGYLDPSEGTDEFEDGWHYTGDLGVIDEDGFIELRGRKGDMIIRGGENVYPAEIEEVLRSNDRVLDAAVTSFPDDVLGERILAVVVPDEQRRLTEETLRETCEEHVPDYKVPDIYRIVDELPRNANGKVQRDELIPAPLEFGIKSGD